MPTTTNPYEPAHEEVARRLGPNGDAYLAMVDLAQQLDGKLGPWVTLDGHPGHWHRFAFDRSANRVRSLASVSSAGITTYKWEYDGFSGLAETAEAAMARADEVIALKPPLGSGDS